MPSFESDFRTLLAGIRTGSEEAAWQLIEQYGPHIRRIVRRRLDRRLRSQFDSVDFVQAVWASFFREPDQIRSFETLPELIKYLCGAARNKVFDEARRRLGTMKYNVLLERSFDDSSLSDADLPAGGPTPDEVAIAREAWSRLVAGQPAQHRKVIQLRFEGATFAEIAAWLKIDERTARKIIKRLLHSRDMNS